MDTASRLLKALGSAAARDAEVASLKAQLSTLQGTCHSLAHTLAEARNILHRVLDHVPELAEL